MSCDNTGEQKGVPAPSPLLRKGEAGSELRERPRGGLWDFGEVAGRDALLFPRGQEGRAEGRRGERMDNPKAWQGSGVTPGGKGIHRFCRAEELEGGAKGEWTLWGGHGPDQTPSELPQDPHQNPNSLPCPCSELIQQKAHGYLHPVTSPGYIRRTCGQRWAWHSAP